MAEVPRNYPQGCTDEQLISVISALGQELLKGGAQVNDVLRIQPLIAVGQAEIQLRLMKRQDDRLGELKAAIKAFDMASTRQTGKLLWLTGALIVVSIALVGLTAAVLIR